MDGLKGSRAAALPVGGSEIVRLLDGGRTWGTWQARQDAASVVV